MDDRERLIEILDTAKIKQEFRSSTGRVSGLYHTKIVNSEYVKPLAELLIANGVTVQKHGRWENTRFLTTGDGRVRVGDCSSCKSIERVARYCPNCGVKMDLEAEK